MTRLSTGTRNADLQFAYSKLASLAADLDHVLSQLATPWAETDNWIGAQSSAHHRPC